MKLKWARVWSILKYMEREKPQKVKRGMFLVATPQLTDPDFRQTVVLICEHGSGGSLGLVVNRRTEQHITEVLPKATGLHEKAGFVYTGGPVQKGSLLILHRLGWEVPESRSIFDGVCLGGDLDFLEDSFPRDEGEGLVRVYMGYAGWAPGQLQFELSSGSWLVLPAQMRMVFARDPLQVWPTILRAQGGAYALYATMPPDPSLN
ncbi:MAG: YqgE/AlgH family protein [Nitrospirales bacterium]|nr:YqgE/AlgH family protein [Nitrospirales bacterium]